VGLAKWQFDEMAIRQNGTLMKWQFDKMAFDKIPI